MSASARILESCSSCGGELPPRARFCPECGAPADAEAGGTTVAAELPPEETGPVPVSLSRVEPRWFGIAPPLFLLGLTLLFFVVALALFVTGHWPYGLILLGLAALALAAFLEAARRRPESAATRTTSELRERAGSAVEALRARAAAAAEARQIQSALAVVEAERPGALLALGEAAHGGDAGAEEAARAKLRDLDDRERDLRARLEEARVRAGERIRRARLSVQDTMMVTPDQPSAPYPPPDEGTPPQPARVPEAYPPPDEGTPPQPAPDPGQDDS